MFCVCLCLFRGGEGGGGGGGQRTYCSMGAFRSPCRSSSRGVGYMTHI